MTKVLNQKEIEAWNQDHQMNALTVEIRIDGKRQIAEVWINGSDHYPLPYKEALHYYNESV